MAIPKPEPRDWQVANAQQLQVTDRQVLQLLRDAKKRVDAILKDLPTDSNQIRRAQLEATRARLLKEQAEVFTRLGDLVSARRAEAASRAARLSAASDAALLGLVGRSAQAQFLYDSALQVSQAAIDAALARMRLSARPLARRIYDNTVWLNGRLQRLINETLAAGLNAKEFAKRARDWFNPNTPGGVRYAAMRLARTEINNAFHAISAEKYSTTPWVEEVEWNLSRAHPRPDECNTLANKSPFPKDAIPARPHPQCMCFITPRQVDEDEFIERFLDGEYDGHLDRELERNGWAEPEIERPSPGAAPNTLTRPVPAVGAVAKMTPDQHTALHAERAIDRQNASNRLYDDFAYGNMFVKAEQGIDRRAGVREYFANSDRINLALRSGDAAEVQDVLDEVDAAMQLTTNREPLVVFRGVRVLFNDAKVGDLITDPIYWSTAVDPQQAKKFARSDDAKLLHLELPAGTHMIAENATETEVLLPRGTTVQVTAIDGENVYAVLVTEVG